jgi:enoyl-CoA hydratase/carnithine racemase
VAFEAEAIAWAFAGKDRVEGMTAFLEKRPPRFGGDEE